MTVRLLTEHHLKFLSLKGSCTGLSESTLVKIPHCWKSHVAAHILPIPYVCTVAISPSVLTPGYVSPLSQSRTSDILQTGVSTDLSVSLSRD